MSRDYSYHTIFADGNTVDISDEAAGYDRFCEFYAYYGEATVEIYPFEFGKSRPQKPLTTKKLSELIDEDDLEDLRKLKELQKDLTPIDKHILHSLGLDWMPPTTYKELENDTLKLPELKKAMARLRKLGLVEYAYGGHNKTRAGQLIWDEKLAKEQEAAQTAHNN